MCISPVRIPNPNLNVKSIGVNRLKDTTSKYINVNCGYCDECIAVKQMQLVQRVQMESVKNHLFFCTLTYNPESIPVEVVNGFSIRYADYSDVSNMFKRLRKSNAFVRPFRHFTVSELGSQRGRPHFHIIFLIPKFPNDDYNVCLNLQAIMFSAVLNEWRRNYGSNRNPHYKPLCTYIRKWKRGKLCTTYDLHYVNPSLSKNGELDVAFYVLKYMLKPSDRAVKLQQALRLNLDVNDYERLWSKIKPCYRASLGFGLNGRMYNGKLTPDIDIEFHLRNNVVANLDNFPYPVFVKPDGSTFPLSRYYKNDSLIYTPEDALYQLDKFHDGNPYTFDEHTLTDFKRSLESLDKKREISDSHSEFDDIEFLFE